MKKILAFCLIFTILLALLPAVTATEGENVTSGCHGLLAQMPIGGTQKKLDTAGSVILYEMNTETMVYAYQPDKKVNPTGMVKLLTALVAIEQGNLDDMVTVYRSTLDTVAIGAVSAGLKAGEQLSLRDLLYCVMVSSANDAAAVIAAHIGGNQASFVELMNQKATELGCTASHFTNAHGLNDPEQYSTARDLAIITEAALQNSVFSEMFSAVSYIVPATNLSSERKLNTTNYMMSDAYIQTELDSRVTGGKPAAATTTDRSMICTAEVGSRRYLCVVMNAKGEVSQDGLSVVRFGIFQEMKALLNFGFQSMQVVQLTDDTEAMYQYPVSGGSNNVILRPSRDVSVVLPQEYDPQLLRFEHNLDAGALAAPIAAGQKLGVLQVSYGDIVLMRCDLLAMNSVSADGTDIVPGQRYEVVEQDEKDGLDRYVILLGLAVGAGVLLVLLVVLIVRWVRTADIRRMHQKRARKRKRGKRS